MLRFVAVPFIYSSSSLEYSSLKPLLRMPIAQPSVQAVSEKLDRFQAEIDAVPPEEADRYESLLRRMRYSLHDNHYLITHPHPRLICQHKCNPPPPPPRESSEIFIILHVQYI
jgi:hypothetical protein